MERYQCMWQVGNGYLGTNTVYKAKRLGDQASYCLCLQAPTMGESGRGSGHFEFMNLQPGADSMNYKTTTRSRHHLEMSKQ